MSKRGKRSSWRRWLLWLGGVFALLLVILATAGYYIAQRFEPYLKEQTAAYLRKRFDSELEWSRFQVHLSLTSPLRLLLDRGKGSTVRVEVTGVVLRHHGRTDIDPLLVMERLTFEADLAAVTAQPAHVRRVLIQGLHLTIPPKGQRPQLSSSKSAVPADPATAEQQEREAEASVVIDRIQADGTDLRIMPKDPNKEPLEFDIHQLRFDGAAAGAAMPYTAVLENALPPGHINSKGSFGPWHAVEPGDSPLEGDYTFRDADLGVFKGIGGILSSTGRFEGRLNQIAVDGVTETPKFTLSSGGTALPLSTKFHAIVDGTNGNTLLQPVDATLSRTHFIAVGAVTKDPKDPARSIVLDINMDDGRVEDMLRLAVKSEKPTLAGAMHVKMKFELLPLKAVLAKRLRIDGNFELLQAQFGSPEVQGKIDTLSRKGQGKPNQREIANVPSDFLGQFHLEGGVFTLHGMQFDVPGALVELDGNYLFGTEALDFHGKLRMQARLSKTQSGWKRILLTPVDPFFAKEGYGTVVRIKVTGSRNSPQFGLDR